jgi:hypothetical protein
MVKRSQSHASSGESEIDHETKPTVTSESDDEYGSSHSKKQKVKGRKGSPKKASPTKSDGDAVSHLSSRNSDFTSTNLKGKAVSISDHNAEYVYAAILCQSPTSQVP